MRIVLDSNVVVSASILAHSVSRKCFDHVKAGHTLLTSGVVLDELLEVIQRSRLDKYITLENRLDFFRAYLDLAELVETRSTIQLCRDDDDNRLVEIAVDGNADLLITGDQDLLVLTNQFDSMICTPRNYVGRFCNG